MADTARVIRQSVQVVEAGPSKARVIRHAIQVVTTNPDAVVESCHHSSMFLAV